MNRLPLTRTLRPAAAPRSAARRPAAAPCAAAAHRPAARRPAAARFAAHRPAAALLAAAFVLLLPVRVALAQGEAPAPTAPETARAADVFAGWQRVLTATSFAERYVPASLIDAIEAGEAVPAVVFLHGAGAVPHQYRPLIGPAAEAAGIVLVMPKSHGQGWGYEGDVEAVMESLERVNEEVVLDPLRTAVAGHSAGGAYAALLTYRDGKPFSGVFTFSAPFAQVDALAPGAGTVPIRMDYGNQDHNFTNGSGTRLGEQWDRLGVPWQQRVLPGVGHNDLSVNLLADGFAFLVEQTLSADRCLASDTAHCLQGGRFRVEVAWQTPAGATGVGHRVPDAVSADSGLFWFFNPANWELLVKVLDGCPVNDHFWVFAAATTNVGHTITVTDTETGTVWSHQNPVGQAAPAVTATQAFDTCG